MRPLATRAVKLCEGCPMAALCSTLAIAPCETPEPPHEASDGGGDYSLPPTRPEVQSKRSYRKELMDDSIPIVMASPTKQRQITPKPIVSIQSESIAKTPPALVRPNPIHIRKRPVPQVERRNGEETTIVAEILASLFSVHAIATSHTKKGV